MWRDFVTMRPGERCAGLLDRTQRRHPWAVAQGEPPESNDHRLDPEQAGALAVGILQTAVDPIIVIDEHGIVVEANDAMTKLFGFALDEVIGHNVSVLMPEPYRSEHDGYIAGYLAGGEARIIGIGREVTARRSDGTEFPMSLAVSEVVTADGRMFTGIIHDLSERNRQRDALREANEQLEQRVAERTRELEELLDELARSNRDLEQFAYIASHDLQAPLRNVRQGLEMLDEHLEVTVGDSFDEEARELRGLVVAAVLRMEELIKGLLTYARLQRFEAAADAVDLGGVIGDVLTGLTLDIEEVGATVAVGGLPQVVGDVTQLHQLFQNLVQNAIRYRAADRTLELAISSRPADRGLHCIEVRDNGIGIDGSHHERIFDLFRRGHSGYEGMGLGLAICQRIAERHGGRIWVESAPDEGATFCVTLPGAQSG